MRAHWKKMESFIDTIADRTKMLEQDHIRRDVGHRIFEFGDTGVEIVLVLDTEGQPCEWVVRMIYDVPDTQNGGHIPISDLIDTFPVGDEALAVKAAFVKMFDAAINIAIDDAS